MLTHVTLESCGQPSVHVYVDACVTYILRAFFGVQGAHSTSGKQCVWGRLTGTAAECVRVRLEYFLCTTYVCFCVRMYVRFKLLWLSRNVRDGLNVCAQVFSVYFCWLCV